METAIPQLCCMPAPPSPAPGTIQASLALAKEEPWEQPVGNVSVPSSWNKDSQEPAPINFSCSQVSEDGRLHQTFRMILLSLLLFVILA